jgi:hypothetical protein
MVQDIYAHPRMFSKLDRKAWILCLWFPADHYSAFLAEEEYINLSSIPHRKWSKIPRTQLLIILNMLTRYLQDGPENEALQSTSGVFSSSVNSPPYLDLYEESSATLEIPVPTDRYEGNFELEN